MGWRAAKQGVVMNLLGEEKYDHGVPMRDPQVAERRNLVESHCAR